ncbi:UDP-N-acetylmuramoylalanine--D-glutamate ligase [Gracilibacillus ureilyticus]|uniref:UDP-N-acetylmuramoylalanine--D-glutamate ligase n=1 Tax=Gracilibacillus ureilyticus TaxID=531814 RepID=A0A1H9KXL7_9BACI|nr:UDP-N-acetylmuramoyl-L-alanine--D-glutamate ligase [Gracilibacillus ureilyticus]SER03910.1 UDP-N-acetylmuramoylalanine--D-glutamate ligase [Gracilibacillus ureilyticus]
MRKLKNFPYKNILVLGLAKSGTAVSKILYRNERNVIVNDLKSGTQDPHVTELKNMGIPVIIGEHPLSLLDGIDVIIKNPGIPYDNIMLKEAIQQGIPIITEIELLHYFDINRLVGITGSNGKTTTTTLIYEMYRQAHVPVKIAGNIGHVASEVAEGTDDESTMVVELSSFQLQGTRKFKPSVSVLLNIFEAHLDFHENLENYQNAKAHIFQNQTSEDFLVYNADDERVSELVKSAKSSLVPFSRVKKLKNGAFIDQEAIFFEDEKVMNVREIALVGSHNLENILAAVAVAKIAGIPSSAVKSVLTRFTGVSHRLQFVANVNERVFFNDSKATNILATSKALQSFDQPVILLAGGLDRGNEFDELLPHLNNVKALVLFGETAEKLSRLGMDAGISSITVVENMSEAVRKSYQLSEEGDVILLSPACASWDQYKTFEERGNMFMESVHRL